MMTTYELVQKQAEATTSAQSNALVAQKDAVLAVINRRDDGDELFEAKKLLDLLHPLWNACGYGYKGRELYRTLRDEARRWIKEHQDTVALCPRKNDPLRRSCLKMIERLEKFVQEL